jgi:polyisoprenoid-binding protein YceI
MVGLAVAGWYVFLKSDAAPRASIRLTRTVATPATELNGTWSVAPGHVDNFVGYRVVEKLPGAIAEQETTGRTDNVTATMTIDGTTISDVEVTADLRDLESGTGLRDAAIRSTGLESDRLPIGTFVLTEPIVLDAVPDVGETIHTRATGRFTLHGVTKRVTVRLDGRWDGDRVQVVGSLPVLFADYDITAPAVPVVASIEDKGEVELQLFFVKE